MNERYDALKGNKPPVLGRMMSGGLYLYDSVAGQPAEVLKAQMEGGQPWFAKLEPLTLMDFIDARVREIDTERNRLSMLKDQLLAADCNPEVDVIRRVLG